MHWRHFHTGERRRALILQKRIEPVDKAIICDIDGTLADLGERSPFDYANVDRDTVKHATAELVRVMHQVVTQSC